MYIVAESRLSQLPSKKAKKGAEAPAPTPAANGAVKPEAGKKEEGGGKNGGKKDKKEAAENGAASAPALETSSYEVVGKMPGAELKGKK